MMTADLILAGIIVISVAAIVHAVANRRRGWAWAFVGIALFAAYGLSIGSAWGARPPTPCVCVKNEKGACARSWGARQEFLRRSGFSQGRPGFHVDHMVPLCCGGRDHPDNMQWLRIEEKRIKDRWELDCTRYVQGKMPTKGID